MTLSRRRFISISAGLVGTMITGGNAFGRNAVRWRGVALGAKADIRLVGIDAQHGEILLAMVRHEISRLEDIFSLYRPESAISKLNKLGQLRYPPPDLLELLGQADTINRLSNGRFDPTVQSLWRLYAQSRGKPAGIELEETRKSLGWDRVKYNAERVILPAGGALTLNGIAQGYITDRVVGLLENNGLKNALVEVGEISAMGQPEGEEGWRVNLGTKEGPEVRLSGIAVATSAPFGTRIGRDGPSHLIDPKTALPAKSNWTWVTVMHRSAALADGASTAAALMTPADIRQMTGRLDNARFIGMHHDLGKVGFTGQGAEP